MTKIALGDEYISLTTSTPSNVSELSSINFGSMSGSIPSGGGYLKTSICIYVPETLYFVKLDCVVTIHFVQIVTYGYSGTCSWTLFGNPSPTCYTTGAYDPYSGMHFSGIVPAGRFDKLIFALDNPGGTNRSITIKIFPLNYFMALDNIAHL